MPPDAPPPSQALSIVVFSGGFDRVHYALVMASAAAASNRRVTLFFTGRALWALLRQDAHGVCGWHRLDDADDGRDPLERDAFFASHGIATFEELLGACAALGVTFMACEMGLKALGQTSACFRDDIPIRPGGVVTFLNDAPANARLLFI